MDKHKESAFRYESEEAESPSFTEVTLVENERLAIKKPFHIKMIVNSKGKSNLVVSWVIKNTQDVWVIHTSDEFIEDRCEGDSGDYFNRICKVPAYVLASGKYTEDVFLAERACEMFQVLPYLCLKLNLRKKWQI